MTILTDKVIEGASFEEFAMEAARAFGPLISLRDTPEAPIPERIEADTRVHEQALEYARTRKREIEAMSEADAMVAANAEVATYKARMKNLREQLFESVAKLRAMRAHAEAWEPPTAEHLALKEHMLGVLDREIEWESRDVADDELEVIGGAEWRRRMIAKLEAEIMHAEGKIAGERERADRANAWLTELRTSLR